MPLRGFSTPFSLNGWNFLTSAIKQRRSYLEGSAYQTIIENEVFKLDYHKSIE